MSPRPPCSICGASLDGRRPQARYCSGACRAEASRIRRIVSGAQPDGFASLAQRLAHRRKSAQAGGRSRYGASD